MDSNNSGAKAEVTNVSNIVEMLISGAPEQERIDGRNHTSRYAANILEKSIVTACNDLARPSFHFLPPAMWNNDPHVFYHQEYYHIFYQFNPWELNFGGGVWGHAELALV